MKIIQVVGARPNFMKVAPLHRAFGKYAGVQSLIVHTGQHSDPNMSTVFLEQLDLPKPDFYLGVSFESYDQLMAEIQRESEKILRAEKPDLVIVVGDVNSTLAGARAASAVNIKLAHVEAGLRSFDNSMQEEYNRIAVDHISDFLFTTEMEANANLQKEGIADSKIHFAGNCMIDSLIHYLPKADLQTIREELKLQNKNYALMTMHRPSNVDTKQGLQNILSLCEAVADKVHVVFPVHPRTRNKMIQFDLWNKLHSISNITLTEPMGYLGFLSLLKQSSLVLTDSGGVQEETTYLNIPCLTYRKSTERPVTISKGSNVLMNEFDMDQTLAYILQILNGNWKKSEIPELWDGRAAERIAQIIMTTTI